MTKCCNHAANVALVLRDRDDISISPAVMYRYLAVMLYSHCTGFSFAKSLTLLTKETGIKLNSTALSFINSNILAYSPTGRGQDGSTVWNAQRDETVMLGQFERRAFRMSSRIFLTPNHTICSLDDDLMGTRAMDNQVKTISKRKADREGHGADVIADALFRVVLQYRYRRRHESQCDSVGKFLSALLETRGEQCLEGIVIAADRGFAKRSLMEELLTHGVGCVGIVAEHLPTRHPFVGKSYIEGQHYEEESEEEEEEGSSGDEDGNEESAGNRERIVYDRPSQYIIDDSPKLGPSTFVARTFIKPGDKPRKELRAVAVREYGTKKHSKVIRFMHSLASPLNGSMSPWIAVPYEHSFKGHLLTTRDDDGRIVQPGDRREARDLLEKHLLTSTTVLTVGQRCADWFVLRQFRLTATTASKFYCNDPVIREKMGYKEKDERLITSSEALAALCKGWFSTNRSTEAMMRGTINEDAVLDCLRRKRYINAVFPVGLIASQDAPWMASSPDALCMIDMRELPDILREDSFMPSVVEIKASVAPSSVSAITEFATHNVIACRFGDATFTKHVREEHAGQILHQMATVRVPGCVYIMASESQIMYTVIAIADDDIINLAEEYIMDYAKPFLAWTQDPVPFVPELALDKDAAIMWSRLPFWRCINDYVRDNGPFPPIRLFRHSSQTVYSNTRGGLDGSSQSRASLRSYTMSPKWEQKVVTHVMKTVTVNAFIAWRMHQKEDLLETKQSFRNLDRYRRALNSVQSLADFTHDVTNELLEHAVKLGREEEAEDGGMEAPQKVDRTMLTKLRAMARARKRNRIAFFNQADMSRLRLDVKNHQHCYSEERYCALCGQNRDARFRGHRTVI